MTDPNDMENSFEHSAVATIRLWLFDGRVIGRLTTVDDISPPYILPSDVGTEEPKDVEVIQARLNLWIAKMRQKLAS